MARKTIASLEAEVKDLEMQKAVAINDTAAIQAKLGGTLQELSNILGLTRGIDSDDRFGLRKTETKYATSAEIFVEIGRLKERSEKYKTAERVAMIEHDLGKLIHDSMMRQQN